MKFEKYHGQGNDFVVVDVEDIDAIAPSAVVSICDRHFGVGADGVLLVSPASDALARMTVLNADGSRPEMCGNGLRCVARHLVEKRGAPPAFDVATDAGLRRCEVSKAGDGEISVAISLGRGMPYGQATYEHGGKTYAFDLVSMGNPHAILFDSPFDIPAIDVIGPAVSAGQPAGANVEFVRQTAPDVLDVIVWERGVGRTMACGTGAGGVVVAAARRGLVAWNAPIQVVLPGGPLVVTVERETLHVTKRGIVHHVFSGERAAVSR